MGASKKDQFSKEQQQMAILGKAIAAPARIAILQHLKAHHFASNKELCHTLQLSKTAVHQHLQFLYKANLIQETFFMNDHGYFLDEKAEEDIEKINWVFTI